MGKCSKLCAWSPAITTVDKMTILSLSYLDLILCNNNLAVVILVIYIFYFESKILSKKFNIFSYYKYKVVIVWRK